MFDTHKESTLLTLNNARQMIGEKKFAESFFVHFFDSCPETRVYFDGTDIQNFAVEKLDYVIDFLLNTLSHQEYAETQIATELMRHKAYGIHDSHYYMVMLDTLHVIVKESLLDSWTKEMDVLWKEVLSHAKSLVQQGVD